MLRRLRKALHQPCPVYQLACCTWRSYSSGISWCEQEADGGLYEVSEEVDSCAKAAKAPSAKVCQAVCRCARCVMAKGDLEV